MSRARDFADLAGSADAGGITGKNLIINGAMQVAQRGTSVTSVSDSETYRTIDRFKFSSNGAGPAFTESQSSTAPDGFSYSFKVDCTTADTSLDADAYIIVGQGFEGQNLQHLKKGTSSAESVTVSFWVRSSKTGTYICEFTDDDNSRIITETYTILSADTWEYKTITFAGDTTGSFDNDAERSLSLNFWLAAGSNFTSGTYSSGSWSSINNANRVSSSMVNIADSTSNDWYITGIQLEVGEQATPFEHRSYGDELARCQRYYFKTFDPSTAPAQNVNTANVVFVGGNTGSSTQQKGFFSFPVQMRANPTLITYNPYALNSSWRVPSTSTDVTPTVAGSRQSVDVTINSSSYSSAHGHLTADAEI
jgi:hypothetical protein